MADKFANLAGYHGEETTFDATAFRSSADGGGGLSQLDESDDGIVPPTQPNQRPQLMSIAASSSRSNTPVGRPTRESSDQVTPRSAKARRALPTSTASSSKNGGVVRRQDIVAVIRDGGSDVDDSFEDSEVELQRIRRDVTTGQDTTAGGDSMANEESGFAGARHVIGRRSAAGISLKDSEARIKKLEADNNELRIECDLWRTQMKPDEARLQIVTISKELARNRRSNVDLMRLLKEQDSSIKESKRILKRWGHLDPKEEQRKRKELEEEIRQAREQVEIEREARLKAEEELDSLIKSEGDQDSRLRQILEEEREDHADALYAVEKEKESIQAQLDEALEVNRAAPDNNELRQMEDDLMELEQHIKSKEAENNHLSLKLEDLQQTRSRQDTELEKLRAQVTESQAAEDSFSRELEVANRRLEHLTTDQQDEILRIREAEDAVAERLGIQIDQLRDEVAEAKLELQNKMGYIETLEAQRDDDDVRFEEMELELERATRALEEKVEEIGALNDELDELDMICQRAKQDAQEADEEVKKLSEVVKLKEDDLIETNKELQKISQALFTVEEENEIIKQEANGLDEDIQQLTNELEEVRERSERKERAYKDRLQQAEQIKAEIQSQLEAIGKEYANTAEDSNVLGRDVDSLQQERRDLKMELEKVYEKLDDAVADLKEEEKKREVLEDELDAKLKEQEDKYRRILAEREEAMSTLERQLSSTEESLANSKEDISKLQDALRKKENESERLGQSHSHDLHSMELETDRLKRDLSRCEMELDRARQDLDRRDGSIREKDIQIDKLYIENRTIASRLGAESQNAKSLMEKLDLHQKTAQNMQEKLQQAQNKVNGLEYELNKGEKTMMQAEQAVKNQLTERNTLLLTIYQYMGKILGNDKVKTGKRGVEVDLKPFTNFAVFNDSLIARLRRVSDIQTQFEQRAKTIEDQYSEKLSVFKRQQDVRFRQIDRFEVAIKNVIDKQSQWRSRVVSKQTELEAVKSTNTELQAQLASLKTRSLLSSPGDGSKLSTLTSRANNAERRLTSAQSQATQAEERLMEAKSKYGEGEGKWAARIKELESRNRAAEEKVKRERQGAKERVSELIEQVRRLETELDGATKRNKLLDNVRAA